MVIFKEKSLKPLDASKENNSVHQARQLESIPVISSTESNRSKDQVSLEELEYLMSTTLTATEKKKQKNKKRIAKIAYISLMVGATVVIRALIVRHLSKFYPSNSFTYTFGTLIYGLFCVSVCFILLVVNIVHIIIYKIKSPKTIVLSLAGLLLPFTIFIII